jgi:hypothetical protein
MRSFRLVNKMKLLWGDLICQFLKQDLLIIFYFLLMKHLNIVLFKLKAKAIPVRGRGDP